MTERDPRQPVEFEAVAVRPRRTRFDPVAIAVVVAAVGLTAAIVKPWDGSTDPQAAAPAIASVPPTSSPGANPLDEPPAVVAVATPPLAWSDVAGIVRPRDEWGIRTILRTPGRTSTGTRTSYDERWIPVSTEASADVDAVAQPGDRSIVALGITTPPGASPLDVRIWRRTTRGTLRWLDARAIGRLPAQGGLLFAPPPNDSGSPAWVAGEYRIDVLTGDGAIQRFRLDIPDRYGNIRVGSQDPEGASELVPPSQVDPGSVPVGAFATIDRVGLPLDGLGGVALDEAAAWLDTEPGSGRAPADRVSVAYLPRATGLGVRVPDGSRIRSASLTRLSPGPFGGSTRVGGGVIDRRNDDPWIVFAARRGEAWDPGTYRIDVTWSDGSAVRESAWLIELRPGPTTGPPAMLAMTRAWARHAGSSGLVVGRAEPLEGGPRSSAIRLLSTTDPWNAAGCDGTVVDGSPEAFGVAYPVGERPTIGLLVVDAPGVAPRAVSVLTARAAVPGLALVVPTDGPTFQPGIYRLTVAEGADARVITACVGGATTR